MFSPYGGFGSGGLGSVSLGAAPPISAGPAPRPTPIDAPILNDLLQVAAAAPRPAASAAGGSGMRTAGQMWDDLKASLRNRGAGINKFLTSRPGVTLGLTAAGLSAAAAAAQAAQNPTPGVTGPLSLVPAGTAAAGSLATTGAGALLGGLVTAGNPLGIAAGAAILPSLFNGAEAGESVGRALIGVSETDQQIARARKQFMAELDNFKAALPAKIAQEDALRRGRIMEEQALAAMRAQAATSQYLWNQRSPDGSAIYGTVI